VVPPEPDGSVGVVHRELDRVRRHLEALHILHLELDIALDEVVVEDAAGLRKVLSFLSASSAPRQLIAASSADTAQA
jgi:hypothetical protein